MPYQILTEDEQDDIMVGFLRSQERDSFAHEWNKARYEAMLSTLEDGDFKVRITKLHAETAARLAEVNSIIEATLPQMPTAGRIKAALARLNAAELARLPTS